MTALVVLAGLLAYGLAVLLIARFCGLNNLDR